MNVSNQQNKFQLLKFQNKKINKKKKVKKKNQKIKKNKKLFRQYLDQLKYKNYLIKRIMDRFLGLKVIINIFIQCYQCYVLV